eukprot:gene5567-50330_t
MRLNMMRLNVIRELLRLRAAAAVRDRVAAQRRQRGAARPRSSPP